MKYHHFDITPIEITEILWNPEEIRWKFDKDLQNLLSLLKFGENCVKFCEKWCKGPEKSEKSGMVQRKKGELEKRWKMRPWTQKSALIQPKTSLGKGLKKEILKDHAGYPHIGTFYPHHLLALVAQFHESAHVPRPLLARRLAQIFWGTDAHYFGFITDCLLLK